MVNEKGLSEIIEAALLEYKKQKTLRGDVRLMRAILGRENEEDGDSKKNGSDENKGEKKSPENGDGTDKAPATAGEIKETEQ